MEMIAQNQSTEENLEVYIKSGFKLDIPAGGGIDLLSSEFNFTRDEIANSDVPYHIQQGNVLLNNGNTTLTLLNSLKYAFNAPEDVVPKTGPDKKLMVYQSSRASGTVIYFSGEGDDPTSNVAIGGGETLFFKHNIGDVEPLVKYFDANCIDNVTYIHEGYLTWKGGAGDTIDMVVVPQVTTYGAGTSHKLLDGYLIVPSFFPDIPGRTNDIGITSGEEKLIQLVPAFDTGLLTANGYWDADFNSTTGLFENITPAMDGMGQGIGHYQMFAAEVPMQQFARKFILVDNGFMQMQTSESQQLGHNMRLKLTLDVVGDDHDLMTGCVLVLHRNKTV